MKRVLVLGAGLVVKPLLDDLLAQPDIELHLGTLNADRAVRLLAGRPRSRALEMNVSDDPELLPELSRADVVISLLPAGQHVRIARACLEHGVPLVTTSYISPEMKALDEEARRRGVLLLNECGLDPGIDHMSAVRLIRRVRRQSGTVVGFASYCGGFPAPEAVDNPWGYKFAWSPRGVLLAARAPVRYLEGGRVVEHRFPDLFNDPRIVEVPGLGKLEIFPNRDCLRYQPWYGLTEVRDFYRGTIRYPGWCETFHALTRLGMLDLEERDWTGCTYADFVASLLPMGEGSLRQRVARRLGLPEKHAILERLAWAGFFSQLPVPHQLASPLDVATSRLQEVLRYETGEDDMVVLEHRFVVRDAGGGLRHITARMVARGKAGDDSAMARTVSLPAAVAARLVLDGKVALSGVQIPAAPELAESILEELAERGIRVGEREEELPASKDEA